MFNEEQAQRENYSQVTTDSSSPLPLTPNLPLPNFNFTYDVPLAPHDNNKLSPFVPLAQMIIPDADHHLHHSFAGVVDNIPCIIHLDAQHKSCWYIELVYYPTMKTSIVLYHSVVENLFQPSAKEYPIATVDERACFFFEMHEKLASLVFDKKSGLFMAGNLQQPLHEASRLAFTQFYPAQAACFSCRGITNTTLECGHSFCLSCFVKLRDQTPWSVMVRCPDCGNVVRKVKNGK